MRPALALVALVACRGEPPDPPAREDGSVRIVQIGMTGGFAIGEGTLVVGPDGSSALIDVGNDAHADEVLAVLDRELGDRHVDAVIITHFHADHVGGLDAAIADGLTFDALVSRGMVDLGGGANVDELDAFADAPTVDLCDPESCDLPWRLDLGGATLEIQAANGFAWDGDRVLQAPIELPDDDDGENARSLAGVVEYGAFVYGFAGDMTGGGKGTPDVESFVAQTAPMADVGVLHLSHHGIDSSSNAAWLDRMQPVEAVAGTNHVYLDAPGNEVMDRLHERLGDGHVWIGQAGSLADEDDPMIAVTGGDVVIDATADGRFELR